MLHLREALKLWQYSGGSCELQVSPAKETLGTHNGGHPGGPPSGDDSGGGRGSARRLSDHRDNIRVSWQHARGW